MTEINLDELKDAVAQTRKRMVAHERRKKVKDLHRTRREGEEEEKNGGMTADEYVAKYHNPDDFDSDADETNLVSHMTLAVIAIAERMEDK